MRWLIDRGLTLRRGLLLALVVGVPLFVLEGVTLNGFARPKFALLVSGTAAVAALRVLEIALGRTAHELRRLLVPATAIALPLAISWAFSQYRGWSLLGEYARLEGLLPHLTVILFGVLLADAFAGDPRPVAWALSLAGGAAGGVALIQALGLDPIVWDPAVFAEYPPSTIGHFNFAGSFMAMTLPVSLYLTARSPRGRWAAILLVLGAVGALLTFSQGAWAAAVGGLALTGGFLIGGKARAVGLAAVVTIGVAVAGSVIVSGAFTDLGAAATARSRAILWKSAVATAAESPVVGHGPNGYALEGMRHRSAVDALASEVTRADDPHSVPLSWLANAGALGAMGFLVLCGWIVRRGIHLRSGTGVEIAFLGAAAAYLVQSLVSVDEFTIRLGFWTALAGVAAVLPSLRRQRLTARTRFGRVQTAAIVALCGAALLTIVFWSAVLLTADYRARQGIDLLEDRKFEPAGRALESAIALRNEVTYQVGLIEALAHEALEAGANGSALESLHQTTRELSTSPHSPTVLTAGRMLHYLSAVDPGADLEAWTLLRHGLDLDPGALAARLEASEVLLDLDRPEDAVALLEPLATPEADRYPEFWGALAIAYLGMGETASAQQAIARGVAAGGSCRVLIADELIAMEQLGAAYIPERQASMTIAITCDPDVYGAFRARLPAALRSDWPESL